VVVGLIASGLTPGSKTARGNAATENATGNDIHVELQFPGEFTLGRRGGKYLVVITSPQTAPDLASGTFDLNSLRLRATIEANAPQIKFDSHVLLDDPANLLSQEKSFDDWSNTEKVVESAATHKGGLHLVSPSNWPSATSPQRVLLWQWDKQNGAPNNEVSLVKLERISNSGRPIYCQLFLWSGSDVNHAEFDVKLSNLTLEVDGTKQMNPR
jgi:hypothetical protein